MIVALPVVLTSWALAALSVSVMAGSIEWGVIPLTITRETVRGWFPNGLGPLSEDYGSGIIVHPEGDPIGQYLYMLSEKYEEVSWMRGAVFFVKTEEAKVVFEHIQAIVSNGSWTMLANISELPQEKQEALQPTIDHLNKQIVVACTPLNSLLKEFPEERRGTARTA